MVDLALTPTGDIIPTYTGSLQTASGIQLDFNDANFRLQTNNPDHYLWPIGANLEDLIGQPNTQSTGNIGIQNIQNALTYDGRFASSLISVDAIPLTLNQLSFVVGIANSFYGQVLLYLQTNAISGNYVGAFVVQPT